MLTKLVEMEKCRTPESQSYTDITPSGQGVVTKHKEHKCRFAVFFVINVLGRIGCN